MLAESGLIMESDCFHYIFVSKLTPVTSELTNTAHWSPLWLQTNSFWFYTSLGPPAAAPLLKSLQLAWLSRNWLLALDARQIMPSSWLQQTGNAPQQVMLQALFRCVVCCLLRQTRLITVAPSFHLLPQCLLFLAWWEQPRSWTMNAVRIKMLCPT